MDISRAAVYSEERSSYYICITDEGGDLASGASDMLGKLICVGVFAMVFFHCVINIGMVLSVVPVIGIPLPFISQGGTSMMMMHFCMGLVLSVSSHRKKAKHMFYTEKD